MEENKNRTNKIVVVVVAVVLVMLIGGASLGYSGLKDFMEADNLNTLEISFKDEKDASDKSTADENISDETTSDKNTTDLKPAPDFTAYDKEGNPVSLSDFRGKPVILNFWASWCGPCKSEMPDFEEAYQEYGEDIQFVMVNLTDGYQETMDSATQFLEESSYSFPVYFDKDSDGAVTYGVYSVPVTYFIDKDGNLVAQGSGALDMTTLEQGIGMIFTEKE